MNAWDILYDSYSTKENVDITLSFFYHSDVHPDISLIPSMNPEIQDLLFKNANITTTHQLIGKFLSFFDREETYDSITSKFTQWLFDTVKIQDLKHCKQLATYILFKTEQYFPRRTFE